MNYDELDPGIRETVRFLRGLGVETSDSGDGVTKIATGWDKAEAMDFPHVWAHYDNPIIAITRAKAIVRELRQMGVPLAANGTPGVTISVAYDPVDESTALMVDGLDDSILYTALVPTEAERVATKEWSAVDGDGLDEEVPR